MNRKAAKVVIFFVLFWGMWPLACAQGATLAMEKPEIKETEVDGATNTIFLIGEGASFNGDAGEEITSNFEIINLIDGVTATVTKVTYNEALLELHGTPDEWLWGDNQVGVRAGEDAVDGELTSNTTSFYITEEPAELSSDKEILFATTDFRETLTLTVTKGYFSEGISSADIMLGGKFTGFTVVKVTKVGESEMALTLEGNQLEAGTGTIMVEKEGFIYKSDTASIDIEVREPYISLQPAALGESAVENTGVVLQAHGFTWQDRPENGIQVSGLPPNLGAEVISASARAVEINLGWLGEPWLAGDVKASVEVSGAATSEGVVPAGVQLVIEDEPPEITCEPGGVTAAAGFEQDLVLALARDGFAAGISAQDIVLGGDFAGLDKLLVRESGSRAILTLRGQLEYGTGTGTVEVAGSGLAGGEKVVLTVPVVRPEVEISGTVRLEKAAEHGGIRVTLINAGGQQVAEMVTGAGGGYLYSSSLPPGNYRVRAAKAGYLGAGRQVTLEPGEKLALPEIFLYGGDVDGDGRVDAADFAAAAVSLGSSAGDAAWCGDVDYDGNGGIDIRDLVWIARNQGLASSY